MPILVLFILWLLVPTLPGFALFLQISLTASISRKKDIYLPFSKHHYCVWKNKPSLFLLHRTQVCWINLVYHTYLLGSMHWLQVQQIALLFLGQALHEMVEATFQITVDLLRYCSLQIGEEQEQSFLTSVGFPVHQEGNCHQQKFRSEPEEADETNRLFRANKVSIVISHISAATHVSLRSSVNSGLLSFIANRSRWRRCVVIYFRRNWDVFHRGERTLFNRFKG